MPWFFSEVTQYPKLREFLFKSQKEDLTARPDSSTGVRTASVSRLAELSKSSKLESSGTVNMCKFLSSYTCHRLACCDYIYILADENKKEFIGEVKEAVAKKKMIDRKLAHSIFIGPPGSGKNSLLHRMRKEFSSSTGVSDAVVIVDIDYNPSTFHSVTVIDTDTWKEVDYDVSLLKQMSAVTASSAQAILVSSESSEGMTSPQNQPIFTAVPDSAVSRQSVAQESAQPSVTVLTDSNIGEMIDAVIEKCGGLKEFQDSFSKGFSLYLRNTGGQMAFQEMHSVLILGPSIFIFVFRADLDLKTKFRVDYRVNARTSLNCNTSSITTEEALLQCLASVYAMDTQGNAGIKTHKPLVFIVGTHTDRLGLSAEEKIINLNEHLDSLIRSSSCFQDLVQYADRDKGQVMFTVDNTSESDDDFKLIRSKI